MLRLLISGTKRSGLTITRISGVTPCQSPVQGAGILPALPKLADEQYGSRAIATAGQRHEQAIGRPVHEIAFVMVQAGGIDGQGVLEHRAVQ